MADIHVRRTHDLGLAQARKTARRWAALAEQKFAVTCTLREGASSDVVAFTRTGIDGQLVVSADAIEITAQLGFLFGAFRDRAQAEIESELDRVLADAAADAKTGAKPARAGGRTTTRKR